MAHGSSSKGPLAFQRWNVHQRLQHILVFLSFIIDCITGLTIKFSYQGWAPSVVKAFGGFDNMFKIHIISGLILCIACVYHLVWQGYRVITGKAGWGVLPTVKDAKDIVQHIKYCLGLTDEDAKFDRYSYKEKFDYWAVFWGMFIIGGSGFLMWIPEWGVSLMPRWVIDCWRIGHSDEAVLAALAIYVWHFYNVHFSPDFFPGNTVWFTGTMPREAMEHEHPVEWDRIVKHYEQEGIEDTVYTADKMAEKFKGK